MDCYGIPDCMIELLLALAYPSTLLCVLLCGSLSCDDHQLVDVSRCEEHPWPIGRWWFRCLVDWTSIFLFMPFARVMTHVLFDMYCVSDYFRPYTLSCLASWCALGFSFHNSWIFLGSESLLRISAFIIICVTCHWSKFIYLNGTLQRKNNSNDKKKIIIWDRCQWD